ncbi:MAG TPA: hypothetical protein ENG98_05090 [Actinobacteria bacterium]|nr:hypothetical protein [Actinomycetota bacterium]
MKTTTHRRRVSTLRRIPQALAVVVSSALVMAACATGATQPTASSETTPSGADSSATTAAPTMPAVRAFTDTPCVGFRQVSETGTVTNAALVELSGIAALPDVPDAYVVHNDTGDEPRIYVINGAGETLATWDVIGARAADWEDISIGPTASGAPAIFIGDIGDNFQFRSSITIYRVPIPALSDTETAPAEFITLTYPNGRADAEALVVDPVTGDIFVITKTREGPGTVYRATAESFVDRSEVMLEKVTDLALGENHLEVTSAAISPTGDLFVLRGYKSVWMWPRTDLDWGPTLATAPCDAASPDEVQGEAITFDRSGNSLVTVSEGTNQPVSRVSADS